MIKHLHPTDPRYLGLQLSQLRFAIENGRDPDDEETRTLVRDRLGCDAHEAEMLMAAAARTRDLEEIAKDMLDDLLPKIMGGAFAAFGERS